MKCIGSYISSRRSLGFVFVDSEKNRISVGRGLENIQIFKENKSFFKKVDHESQVLKNKCIIGIKCVTSAISEIFVSNYDLWYDRYENQRNFPQKYKPLKEKLWKFKECLLVNSISYDFEFQVWNVDFLK